jgi:hypothetical protein
MTTLPFLDDFIELLAQSRADRLHRSVGVRGPMRSEPICRACYVLSMAMKQMRSPVISRYAFGVAIASRTRAAR